MLWYTVLLGRAIEHLRTEGMPVDDALLGHLSPLGWKHVNLTGDYVWSASQSKNAGAFRVLRDP